MENFWTSKNPIKGLSHFVLVNEIKKRDKVIVSLVSVIDVEINLKSSTEAFYELKKKLKPLCEHFVDFGCYLSEKINLD